MTECEGKGRRDLGYNVHGGHNEDRLGEALKPVEKTLMLDVVIPYHTGGNQRPRHCNREVCRGGTEKLCSTDKGSDNRGHEECADVGRKLKVMLAHCILNHVVKHGDYLFKKHLNCARALGDLSG